MSQTKINDSTWRYIDSLKGDMTPEAYLSAALLTDEAMH